jgi:MFS family permease
LIFSRLASEFSFIRGNFLLIIIGWLVIDFTSEMANTYYPLYVEALGGTAATVGLIYSVSNIIQAITRFPGGYIADKYGRKWIISSMTFLVGFSYLFYILAPNWQTILLGAILGSFCRIYMPAHDAIIMDSLPQEKRGMGYSVINLITKAATTPSPLIAGLLYLKVGLVPTTRIAFSIVLVAYVFAGLLRLRLTETMKETQRIDWKELFRSFSEARVFVEGIRVWNEVPRTALALLIIGFIFLIPNAMLNVVVVFWIVNDLGVSLVNLSILMTTISVSMILLALPAGKIIDKIGRKTPLLLGFVLTAVAMPLLLYGDFIKLLIAVPAIGLINIIFGTAISALYADMIPPEHRGRISGSRSFFQLIALSSGQILGGFIYDNISHQLPLLIFWASTAPSFLLTLFFVKEPESKEYV